MIFSYQNMDSNIRRRDLYQALSSNMESIFSFFVNSIDRYCILYNEAVEKAEFCQVVQVRTLIKKMDFQFNCKVFLRIFCDYK